MFGVLLRLYIKHVCCHHAISTTLLLDGKITRIPWGVTISSWIPRLIIDSVKHWCWWCKYPKLPWRYFLGLRSMWYHHWIYNLIDIIRYGCMKITNIKIQMFSNTSQFCLESFYFYFASRRDAKLYLLKKKIMREIAKLKGGMLCHQVSNKKGMYH